MSIEQKLRYTNRIYEYDDEHDTFDVKGLHLNDIRVKVNEVIAGYNRHITIATVVSIAATLTLDFTEALHQEVSLGANTTITLTNLNAGDSFSIVITNVGGFTVAFNSSIHWEDGADPTISAAASAVDLITGIYDGTVARCGILQNLQ